MPDEGGVYLALGDSITFGVGVPNPRRGGYVGRLSDRLALADPPITETRVFAVPGETATGQFTATEVGTFKVICAEPGHEQLGMVGELVVEP